MCVRNKFKSFSVWEIDLVSRPPSFFKVQVCMKAYGGKFGLKGKDKGEVEFGAMVGFFLHMFFIPSCITLLIFLERYTDGKLPSSLPQFITVGGYPHP